MMAWYEDIKNLTEKTGEARNAFVRRRAPSLSGSVGYYRPSIDSERALAVEDDEADGTPYMADRHALSSSSAAQSHRGDEHEHENWRQQQQRSSQAGGRIPGEIKTNTGTSRHIRSPSSPNSPNSPQSSERKSLDHRHSLVSSRTRASTVGTSLNNEGGGQASNNVGANMADGYYMPPAAPPGNTSPDGGGGRPSRGYGEWMTPLSPTSTTTSTSQQQRKHHRRHNQSQQQDQHHQHHQQQQQVAANDHHPADGTSNYYHPPPTANEHERMHSHPIASSTGAPIIVPDANADADADEADNPDPFGHPPPPTIASKAAPAPTKTVSGDVSASPDAEGEGEGGDAPELASRTVSLDPSMSSRRSTGSERMRVPGQFPA